MSDWLMSDDSADGGYLGMDDPAMPDSAPTPPSAPAAMASASDSDWLGSAASVPQDGHVATAAPVMDGQGDWLGGMDEPAVDPGHGAAEVHYEAPMQYAQAPMAQASGLDISVTSPQLQQLQPTRALGSSGRAAAGELSNVVLDVEVQVEVGLGNAALTVEEFLEMGRGSVVELDTPIDAPIELKVRGKLIARGQLVSINGSYGMRIVEMLDEEH